MLKSVIIFVNQSQEPIGAHVRPMQACVEKKFHTALILGIITSEDLKWSGYINKITAEANSTQGF